MGLFILLTITQAYKTIHSANLFPILSIGQWRCFDKVSIYLGCMFPPGSWSSLGYWHNFDGLCYYFYYPHHLYSDALCYFLCCKSQQNGLYFRFLLIFYIWVKVQQSLQARSTPFAWDYGQSLLTLRFSFEYLNFQFGKFWRAFNIIQEEFWDPITWVILAFADWLKLRGSIIDAIYHYKRRLVRIDYYSLFEVFQADSLIFYFNYRVVC